MPATALVNRLRVALREWVLTGKEPPASKWPLMGGAKHERNLVEATKAAMGFPSGVPGIPDSIFLPENFVFPVFDYDWGPDYDHSEANGVPTNAPPGIKGVVKMMVPRVDADGNELGGVPTVLRDAPLGTYLGWNITSGGIPRRPGVQLRRRHGAVREDQGASKAAGDPRPSLRGALR